MGDRPTTRRWLRRVVVAALVLAALFYGGGGWYFSNLIDERGLDGAARRASSNFEPDTEVVALTDDAVAPGGSITLAVGDEPGSLRTEGVWGLRWDGGYGRVAGILDEDDGTVTRAFLLVEGERPAPGEPAELDPRAWPAPQADEVDVIVEGPLGDHPAWFVPGERSTWAIVVHGNAMVRTDGIRLGPVTTARSMPTLWITYRNDVGAPEDPSGRLAYGLTEWQDLEAAVRYALDEGASEVVLAGYSMGGGVIMAFLQRSELADRVRGVVLDAPMLDFSTTVDDNASRETLPVIGVPLPSSLTAVAKWIADRRFDIRWDELDYLDDVEPYEDLPFLVFHGRDDTTVPIGTSRTFAELLPEQVQLFECPEAEHIECWNVDTETYERELRTFLDRVDPEG